MWLVDDGFADNNTSVHPGAGYASRSTRAAPFTYPDGTCPTNRREPFDATSAGRDRPGTCLHKEVVVGKGQTASTVAGSVRRRRVRSRPTFDDTLTSLLRRHGQPAELGRRSPAWASRPTVTSVTTAFLTATWWSPRRRPLTLTRPATHRHAGRDPGRPGSLSASGRADRLGASLLGSTSSSRSTT